jgi:hypothetical protein
MENSLEFLRGTSEHIKSLNDKLISDMAIYRTRPFLNKQERTDLSLHNAAPGRNQIIANFCFNESGQFLPMAYTAPIEITKMLYPLAEIIEDERRGTIIIDREQYDPNLKNLSFFIYMVDEELYEYYKREQNFRGASAPTFMFDKRANNGLRVFKDHFALVRHLKNQRLVTYCFGPRTAFYLRYYLKYIETVTISNKYSYGPACEEGTCLQLLKDLDRHMAFNTTVNKFELEIKLSTDMYRDFRKLTKAFKTNIPEIETFNNKIMVHRYSKQTMHARTLCRLTINGGKKDEYKALGVMPYHHLLVHDNKLIAFVWDTREIQAIVPIDSIKPEHITYNVNDSRHDIVVKGNSPEHIKIAVESMRSDIPVQMRYEEQMVTEMPSFESNQQ